MSKYEKNVDNINIYLAKNPYSEIEYVAKQIYSLVKTKNYRYKDIVVMTKQIENYGSLCKAIFQNYNIPVFLDEKKELSQNELSKYILSILEVYSKNWSYESVMYQKKIYINLKITHENGELKDQNGIKNGTLESKMKVKKKIWKE